MRQTSLLKKKTYIALVFASLTLLLTLPMISYAAPQTIHESNRQHEMNRSRTKTETRRVKDQDMPLMKGWNLNVAVEGTAVNITDSSMTKSANATFNVIVDKVSMGQAKLKATEGELKIEDTAYSIKKGWGLVTLRSGKIIIHLEVTSLEDDAKLHVVLKGNLSNSDSVVHVDFTKPQSKLARQFFLSLSGTVRRIG